MNILGVIPARGGSKEIPRKNLLKIKNKTLIELAINSASESKMLTKTIFSSDDAEMINVANGAECEVPFIRPKELASDKASSFLVLDHAVKWLAKNEKWSPDIIVLLQPTTPFRQGHHIDGVIKLLLDTEADAAITVRKPDYPPYWMLEMDSKKRLKNLINAGNEYTRRQDTPKAYQPAGMVYAFKADLLSEINTLFPFKDTRGYLVSSEEAINIDSILDYTLAKVIVENQNNTI